MTNIDNHDIVMIYDLLNRDITETYKSNSSGSTNTNIADYDRALKRLDGVDRWHGLVISLDALDLVETHPKEWELRDPAVWEHIDNPAVNAILRLLEVTRDELVACNSARDPSGLAAPDSKRLTDNIEKIRRTYIEYVEPTQPQDFPKSSPKEPSSGKGK